MKKMKRGRETAYIGRRDATSRRVDDTIGKEGHVRKPELVALSSDMYLGGKLNLRENSFARVDMRTNHVPDRTRIHCKVRFAHFGRPPFGLIGLLGDCRWKMGDCCDVIGLLIGLLIGKRKGCGYPRPMGLKNHRV